MKSLYFGIDNDGRIDSHHHAEHATMDYSLCGMGNIEDSIETNHKIDCPECIRIIQHCKRYKAVTDYSYKGGKK